jgi:hypothetical protein
MKQTAVEWFEDQVGHNSLMGLKEFNEIFEKSKEMEKEQIIEVYKYGNQSDVYFKPEQYYNETFKSE